MDVKLLAQGTNLDSTNGTTLVVSSDGSTEACGELKDVRNFRGANDEVCAAAKRLAMDLS